MNPISDLVNILVGKYGKKYLKEISSLKYYLK